jgi:hypothetical protein
LPLPFKCQAVRARSSAPSTSQYLEALDMRLKLAAVFDHDDRRVTIRRDDAV